MCYVFGTSCPLLDSGKFDVKLDCFSPFVPLTLKLCSLFPSQKDSCVMHLTTGWDKGPEHAGTFRASLRFKEVVKPSLQEWIRKA